MLLLDHRAVNQQFKNCTGWAGPCVIISEIYAPELVDFRRFIDDIAGTWERSEDAFNTWADKINAQLQSRLVCLSRINLLKLGT